MVPPACQTCSAVLPAGASYCPGCGTATPTGISAGTVVEPIPKPDDPQARKYRERLQQALGFQFELKHELGRGGFAEVHAAWDVRLKRHVAVKTLRHDLAGLVSADLIERFQREAEAMAQLSHPNIMPIYAVGEGEGIVYFIMPLATGKPLSAKLMGGEGLRIGEARRITLEIARALEHAHRAGVVHRDVKPDNIMLEGDEERVLVTDFGIAKAAAANTSELTAVGMAIGTPAYMSPEQATGEPDIDCRADLYALGVVAFQMLTGQLPFSAPTALGFIAKQASETPPKVSALRTNCPRALADAVDRCLAKSPDDRFDSAAELCHALETRTSASSEHATMSVTVPEPLPSSVTGDPLRAFRRAAVSGGVVTIAAFVVDLLTNRRLDFAPLVLVAGTLLVGRQYSRLWMAGFSWRDAVRKPASDARDRLGGDSDKRLMKAGPMNALEVPEGLLMTARADRAQVVRLLAQIPQTERQHVAAVVPALDESIARMRVLVDTAESTEKALAERRRIVQSYSQGGRSTSLDERAVEKLEADRDAIIGRLESQLSAVRELRDAVDSAVQIGVEETAQRIADSVESLNGRAADIS